MRFLRSRTPNPSGRKPRAQKIPEELAQEITKDPKKASLFFDLWLGHGEDWMRVQAFWKKTRRLTSGTEVTQAWLTKSQLMKMYGKDKAVVDAIVKSRDPASQVRFHPDAPGVEAAKQYHVTVFDAESKKDEKIEESGLAGDGLVEDKELAKKIGEGLMAGGVNTAAKVTKHKSKEEKDQAKKEREDKKQDLKNDPTAHAKAWLSGMSKDVAKAIDALAQCKKSKDKTVGVSYTQKFNTHISTLKKTRARIENPGKEPISKKDMKNAEACVMASKDDLSAWNRIKPIYVKD